MNSTYYSSRFNHPLNYLGGNFHLRPLRNIGQAGYTLIELMIVVTMIGIISSIAYASFTGYTATADRGDAQADLYELAQVMERAFTENRTYASIDLDATVDSFSDNSLYTFSIPTQTATDYEIVATATDSRDTFDLKINQRGVEEFRTYGTTAWSGTTGTTGWENIE